jgi:hypothetical protein
LDQSFSIPDLALILWVNSSKSHRFGLAPVNGSASIGLFYLFPNSGKLSP